MEPLQEAIEQARLKREGEIGRTAPPGETHPQRVEKESIEEKDSPRPDRNASDDSGHCLASQVNYSSTRLVEPADEQLAANRVIASENSDPRVEVYRQLRSQILAKMKRNNWRSLAITSAQEGAGKTLTAVNLAITISQQENQTVLLVDLDLRKPDVHTTLGLEISKGIVDHLIHGEPVENILLNPGYPRLVVLPGLPQGRYSSEVLSSPQMNMFIDDITGRYPERIIIFDLPPLLRNDDAMVFVPNADACLYVVEDGVTQPDEIERSMQLLKHSHLIGTVLNKVR
ncbi:MAG: CpsD/CapB family tyrosine-protein kinase [Halioglobus sp.]|nr:CpsD/CapB family tyrosine-protein kinase [Halioglobus sp.]